MKRLLCTALIGMVIMSGGCGQGLKEAAKEGFNSTYNPKTVEEKSEPVEETSEPVEEQEDGESTSEVTPTVEASPYTNISYSTAWHDRGINGQYYINEEDVSKLFTSDKMSGYVGKMMTDYLDDDGNLVKYGDRGYRSTIFYYKRANGNKDNKTPVVIFNNITKDDLKERFNLTDNDHCVFYFEGTVTYEVKPVEYNQYEKNLFIYVDVDNIELVEKR